MKRRGFLLDKIADFDNLRLAFWKAKRGKGVKSEVLEYQKHLDSNLAFLREQILESKISVGKYNYFKIYEPKERQICAAAFSERVLHHALMNVCHQEFEEYQIFDSYASRIGKGTFAAIERAKIFQKKFKFFLKLDVRKYFDSIDHQTLKSLLSKQFKDVKLLSIFSAIIDSYETLNGKGVPIGNLTSQYFANHYLSISDHYIKENLKIKGYVRYMDDMVLWANDKDELNKKGKELAEFILLKLKLELKPFCLNKTTEALPFLGYLVYPNKLKLSRNSRDRFTKKLHKYQKNIDEGIWNQNDYQRHILPLLSFVKYADTFGFRTKCMQIIHHGK